MDQLRLLLDAGLEVHTQVVLCPEWNDGPHLDRTIEDVATVVGHSARYVARRLSLVNLVPAARKALLPCCKSTRRRSRPG